MARSKAAASGDEASDGSKARILGAARRSFASVGFDGASTRQIAADAGVAQSLLLYHYGSKDALWRAVMTDLFSGLEARVARAQRAVKCRTTSERLMATVTAFIGLCAEDADIHRIMTLEGRQETARLKWLVEEHLSQNHRRACDLIRRGQAEGVVRQGDPTLLYYTFIAIAGTAFSLAPEIRLVSRDARVVEQGAVADLIRSLLIVREDGGAG